MSTSAKDLPSFLHASFSSVVPSAAVESDLNHISPQLYPNTSYTDNEKIEISQWLITSSHLVTKGEDEAKHIERLGSLNIHLSTRTTLLGSKPSVADLALFYRLAPAVKEWSPEERTGEKGYHHIVRHVDSVQNSPIFGLSLKDDEKVDIAPSDVKFIYKPLDAKEEKERKKKEKATAAAVAAAATSASSLDNQSTLPIGKSNDKPSREKARPCNEPTKNPPALSTSSSAITSKKEKKEKPPKQPKPAPAPAPLSPSLTQTPTPCMSPPSPAATRPAQKTPPST